MLLALFVTLASTSVSGRVVDAESLAPIAGARVVLALEQAAFPPAATSGDEAVTDKEGRFVFPNAEPGRYRLDAVKKGFASLRGSRGEALIEVGNAPIEGLELALTKGATISGRIVETTGAPQPRLSISALKVSTPPTDLSTLVTAQTTQTDENGEFFLQDLPDGNYLVMAAPGKPVFESSASGALLIPSPTYYPGTPNKEAAQIITVAYGQAISDLQFSIVSARGYQVSGVVVDRRGVPVNDATVALVMETPRGGMSVPSTARSDLQGIFQMEGVMPGSYRIFATATPGTSVENMPGVRVRVIDGNVDGLRIQIPNP